MRIPSFTGHAIPQALMIAFVQFALPLFLLTLTPKALALKLGETFPDFSIPSAFVDYGQRLSEQRGKPVMLLVLERCDACDSKLRDFTALAQSYAQQDLVTWVLWSQQKDDQPPRISVPVLNVSHPWQQGWKTPASLPALYLINPDGTLEQQFFGSIRTLHNYSQSYLSTWMQSLLRPQGQ